MDEADLACLCRARHGRQAQASEKFHLAHSLKKISDLRFEISDLSACGHAQADGPGVCEDCGGEIPAARRKAVPGCTRCVGCQKEAEGR